MNPALARKYRADLLADKERFDAASQRIGSILKAMDEGSVSPGSTPASTTGRKRRLTQAVKNRIADAQRARWARIKAKKNSKAAKAA
jgi:hypothetical protein